MLISPESFSAENTRFKKRLRRRPQHITALLTSRALSQNGKEEKGSKQGLSKICASQ